jgi:ribosomal protein S18 acetylase RimI-like enzyme
VIESRLAHVGDSAGIVSVQQEAWHDRGLNLIDEIDPDQLAATWTEAIGQRSDLGRIMVTTSDDLVVGYCVIEKTTDINVVQLTALEVSPRYRKIGIGSRLINMAADVSDRMGAHEIHAWIGENEAPAKSFLTSAGWALTGASRTLIDESSGITRQEIQLQTAL